MQLGLFFKGSAEVQEEIALVEIRQEDQENVDIILDR